MLLGCILRLPKASVQTYSYYKEIMDRVGCLIEELGVLSASMGGNTSKSVYLRNAETIYICI